MQYTKTLFSILAALIAVAAMQTVAHAHFIWATVQNGQARFALLENIAEAPSSQFESYVANLSPRVGGKTLPLGAVKEGARYGPLSADQNVVEAESIVGTRSRDNSPAYLLIYDAKGAATLAAASTITRAPAELTARQDGKTLVVSVLQSGKPAGQSEIGVQWPGDKEATVAQTDSKGEARIAWPAATSPGGFVGIRTMVTEAKPGENAGKKYASVHRWVTLTFPLEGTKNPAEKPFTQILRASLGSNHEIVSNAAFNQTVFDGKLTKKQLEIHLQQRALVHNETHRILTTTTLPVPYGAAQKNVLVLLFTDLINMGSGWPTEPQARPITRAFLQEIRDSERVGPFFALGVQHVYYGGITNGGRTIGEKIGETLHFTPTYYEKSDGYEDYLVEVNKITDPAARREMIRGAQAVYKYIIASSNEDVFKAK